jgi:hypothetical protein
LDAYEEQEEGQQKGEEVDPEDRQELNCVPPQSQPLIRCVHTFTGNSRGMKRNEAPETYQNSTPLDILMLLFTAVLHLLVE